jgi:small conductance mechanosensitive channel
MSTPHRPRNGLSLARAAWELLAVVVIAVIAVTILLLFLRETGVVPHSATLYVNLVVIVVAAVVVIRFIARALQTYVVPRASPGTGSALRLLFNVLAYLALIFGVFEYLGIDITTALVGAGFLGIVLGLAAQTVLGNMLAALSILASRPFVVGEFVTVVSSSFPQQWETFPHETEPVGFSGTVREIGLIYTVIEGPDGIPLHFANGSLMTSMVINHSRGVVRQVRARLTVPRSVSFKRYQEEVGRALAGVPDVVPGSVRLRIVSVGEHSYDVVILVGIPAVDAEDARSKVLERILTLDLSSPSS